MGSKCFKKKIHPRESREDFSPPVKLPTVKKQSIVRTTDDMPMNRLFLPLNMNKENSNDSNTIERQNSNNMTILPPKTPRTIIHTSSLQKRRNSEVFIRKMKLI